MQAKESQNSRAQDEAAEENKADQKALTAQHIFLVSFEISENVHVRMYALQVKLQQRILQRPAGNFDATINKYHQSH